MDQKKKAGRIKRLVTPLAQRIEMARKVNEHRRAHPRMLINEVIVALGLHDKMSEKNYYPWRALLEKEELRAKANGAEHPDVEHFPLAIIPEKRAKKPAAIAKPRELDENKRLAASLLEVAAQLLKR